MENVTRNMSPANFVCQLLFFFVFVVFMQGFTDDVRVQGVRFPVHLGVCVSGHFNNLAAVAFLPPPRSPAKNMREPRFPPLLSY